jgi:hypothetical protein
MASTILSHATDKVKDMAGEKNQKIADLSTATKDVHDKSWKMTSDYGVKQNNTDHWLTIASEDKTGPMLLEDPFGREKVLSKHSQASHIRRSNIDRSIVLITSAFRNVLSMPEVLAPMASSRFSNQLQMLPPPAS